MTARRILVIEDDADIARLLAINLGDLGYRVELAGDGEQGLVRAETRAYDLVVLDLRLPRLDGIEVCRRLRAQPRYVPILMLTARSTELERVLGLEMGADDYVTKPFSVRELQARVKAIFRRVDALEPGGGAGRPARIELQGLDLDLERRQVAVDGQPVELTAREFDLLALFARHPGRVYTRAQLLDQVWGYSHDGCEHTVNSHINRLRAKIEHDPRHPRRVLTVWGVGYKFCEPPPAAKRGA